MYAVACAGPRTAMRHAGDDRRGDTEVSSRLAEDDQLNWQVAPQAPGKR